MLPAFAALWFGIAAICVGIISWIFPFIGLTAQLVIWIILSVLCTFLWFKFIKPLSIDKTKGLDCPVKPQSVRSVWSFRPGLEHDLIKVRFPVPVLGSDEWNCRTQATVQVGDRVRVVDITGNDLVVLPHQSITSAL